MSDPEDVNPRYYQQKKAREEAREKLHKDNPSLSWGEVCQLYEQLEAARAAARPTRCCVCQSSSRAEYVSTPEGPAVCRCACHRGGSPRP